jgi:hypothetical protein
MYTRRTLALASLASPALFCSQVRAESAKAVTSTQPGATAHRSISTSFCSSKTSKDSVSSTHTTSTSTTWKR